MHNIQRFSRDDQMMKRANLFLVVLLATLAMGTAQAQLLPFDYRLLPANPTSADNMKLSIASTTCGGITPYEANPYTVGMSQNKVTVTLGRHLRFSVNILCPSSPQPREEIDLGRLPAGSYTLTLFQPPGPDGQGGTAIDNAPFNVTDARATKTAPYVRLDYAGHWWDPNDSGWGLFIWHDARDNVLAAWFTYTSDGKPMWYVFQPKWTTSSSTVTTPLLQTSRLPGPTGPPPAPTSYATVGSASLDFTNFGTADVGKITYTFTGGAQQVRNIQRFKP